jgi:hypothetical protein
MVQIVTFIKHFSAYPDVYGTTATDKPFNFVVYQIGRFFRVLVLENL